MANRRRAVPRRQEPIEWHFFSFPSLASFFFGAFVATLLFPAAPPIVFIVSLFGVSFSVAHIMSHWYRRRTLERRRLREDEQERERRALEARAAAPTEPDGGPARRRRRRRG